LLKTDSFEKENVMAETEKLKVVTTRTIIQSKKNKTKIAALTAYDAIVAHILDESGIDIILVGDSLSNVVQGNDTTIPVTLEEMIYHAKIVNRAVRRALVVVDMPFMSFQVDAEETIRNAGRILKETGASAVKVEGGKAIAESIRRMTEIGIPVMGHLGLTPQSINKFGGYRPRGEEKVEAARILADAKLLEDAGAFAIVLEKIPAQLAAKITKSIGIPTIGIGAGAHCDGQVLVYADMVGLTKDFKPRFVRHYANLADEMHKAFVRYIEDVKGGKFPSEEESY
jgi:3-methyl-2-oxobutanoate hydroxymethyltransferase